MFVYMISLNFKPFSPVVMKVGTYLYVFKENVFILLLNTIGVSVSELLTPR